MSNQPVRWLPNAVERAHNKALDALDRRTDLAGAEVIGLGKVEAQAHFAKAQAALMRQQAEHLVPDAAEELRMISIASTVGMVNVISRYSQGR